MTERLSVSEELCLRTKSRSPAKWEALTVAERQTTFEELYLAAQEGVKLPVTTLNRLVVQTAEPHICGSVDTPEGKEPKAWACGRMYDIHTTNKAVADHNQPVPEQDQSSTPGEPGGMTAGPAVQYFSPKIGAIPALENQHTVITETVCFTSEKDDDQGPSTNGTPATGGDEDASFYAVAAATTPDNAREFNAVVKDVSARTCHRLPPSSAGNCLPTILHRDVGRLVVLLPVGKMTEESTRYQPSK